MKLIFTSTIFLIILISNNLFLFNEEFLILISFIGFCFIIHEKLSPLVHVSFQDKIFSLKTITLDSLNNVHSNLVKKKKMNKEIKNFKLLFSCLKNHYLALSKIFLNNLLNYLNNKEKSSILLKLTLLNRIEKDYTKIIFLLINKKIILIGFLLKFFNNNLKIKKFKTISLINKLVLIKKI